MELSLKGKIIGVIITTIASVALVVFSGDLGPENPIPPMTSEVANNIAEQQLNNSLNNNIGQFDDIPMENVPYSLRYSSDYSTNTVDNVLEDEDNDIDSLCAKC